MSDRPLDPSHSLVDYARLVARLSRPFAQAQTVLASAQVSEDAFALARAHWRERLAKDKEASALFARAFRAELEDGKSPRAPEEPPDVDETMLAPAPGVRPALPFRPGAFHPEPVVSAPRAPRPAWDPDATAAPNVAHDVTLPFAKPTRE